MKITKPTFLIDRQRCQRNIQDMADKARRHKLIFRPHFKTHQSLEIGRWFKDHGVDKITVSSLEMAEYFSEEWQDITVAFPANILERDLINKLSGKIKLNLLVESKEVIQFLNEKIQHKIGIFIKIDIGNNRTGILPTNINQIETLINEITKSNKLTFLGFLCHAGQTYQCRSKTEILKIHQGCLKKLSQLKNHFIGQYPELMISFGDTPSCSVAEDFHGIDEIRPGNFVYYDLMQVQVGACSIDQIAVAVACPIVASHRERSEIIIYGGGVHFSKEYLIDETLGKLYGRAVEVNDDKWSGQMPAVFINSLSQEHGIVSVPIARFDDFKIGDLLFVLPVHSCLTANLMGFGCAYLPARLIVGSGGLTAEGRLSHR